MGGERLKGKQGHIKTESKSNVNSQSNMIRRMMAPPTNKMVPFLHFLWLSKLYITCKNKSD